MFNVSVVIPAYNAEKYIGRALTSVYCQSVRVQEVVVIDDGSTDETRGVVRAWEGRLPIRLTRLERNYGIRHALNVGVGAAQGDYIARLDADDVWRENHVELLRDALLSAPEVVLASSQAQFVDQCGRVHRVSRAFSDGGIRKGLMWDNPIVHSATAFRKSTFVKVGGYRQTSKWEDYDLWIRLLLVGRYAVIREETVLYTVGSESLSRVTKSLALGQRFVCQCAAIKAFGMSHPFAAIGYFIVSLGRVVMQWILRFGIPGQKVKGN